MRRDSGVPLWIGEDFFDFFERASRIAFLHPLAISADQSNWYTGPYWKREFN
jgi:hypothetical protein